MKPPSLKYLRQELLRAIRIANKDERVKALEREVELLKGNLAQTNKRLDALVKYLKVEFVYQKEKYIKK